MDEPDSVRTTPAAPKAPVDAAAKDTPPPTKAADKQAVQPPPKPKPLPPVSPIVAEHDVRRMDFTRRQPPVKARIARVLITARGDYLVIAQGRQVTARELLRKRVRSVCEVDMGQHVTHIDDHLPSMGDAFRFHASVDVHWHVVDPMRVVMDGLTDVRAALAPVVAASLSRVTRTYPIEECERAEHAVNSELARLGIGAELGLATRTFVRLSMDNAVRDGIKLKERVRYYKGILASGDLNQFALRLAQNPGDVAEVVQALIEERDTHRKDTVDLIATLIRSGAIDRWEIDDQVRTVLQWLRETTNRVITGTDEARQFSLGNATDAAPITHTNGGSPTP